MKRHIESFPRIESHFTRRDTRKLYLDQLLSISGLYALYTKEFEVTNSSTASVEEEVYRKIFCKECNLSFFCPKKLQYSKCTNISAARIFDWEGPKPQIICKDVIKKLRKRNFLWGQKYRRMEDQKPRLGVGT